MPTPALWLVIWVAAFLFPRLQPGCLVALTALLWLSALVLAPGKLHGRRLLKAAAIFALIWSAIIAALHLAGLGSLEPLVKLWAWLALGLHLMLAKSPLELALPLGRLAAPVIGRIRAQKLALALALTARLIPRLIDSALKIRKSLELRAPALPLKKRLTLWSQAILRDAFSQSEEMARALLKRWPW